MNKKNQKEQIYWLSTCIFFVVLMIFIGGITRLTESGLSITEWKPITGIIPPLSHYDWQNEFELYKETPEFKKINFAISFEEFRSIYLIEYFHRLLGRILALVFFLPFIYFVIKKQFTVSEIRFYLLTMFFLGFQGFVGWYMVKSGLSDRPDVSHFRLAMHLSMAIVILSMLLWKLFSFYIVKVENNKNIKIFSTINLIAIVAQIIFGAFVAGLDAGRLYNDFPLMNGDLVPIEFNNVRPFIPYFSDPGIVQFFHRIIAYMIFLNSIILLCYTFSLNILKRASLLVGIVLAFQIILGILTLVLHVPIFLAAMHQMTAIGLYSVSFYVFYTCFKGMYHNA